MLTLHRGRIVRVLAASAALAGASTLAGCATKQVSRIDPATVTDLSGRWNDTDSRLVANELIEQSLGADWARSYARAHGGEPPALIVGGFENRSMEHIPVGTFVRDLERAYLSSGAVRVVAASEERAELRAERADQQEHAQAATRARPGQEQGARYLLRGDLQSIEDGAGGERVRFYQVDAALVDLETNVKVWAGQHKIKKYVERRRFGF